MKKPHNKINILLGLAAFGLAAGYAGLREIDLRPVGGAFLIWMAAQWMFNLMPEPKSGRADVGGIMEQAAVDAANTSARWVIPGPRGSGFMPSMSPTGNIQLDDDKKLLPLTWAVIFLLYWWLPILAAEQAGIPGTIPLFPEPWVFLMPAALSAADLWCAGKRKHIVPILLAMAALLLLAPQSTKCQVEVRAIPKSDVERKLQLGMDERQIAVTDRCGNCEDYAIVRAKARWHDGVMTVAIDHDPGVSEEVNTGGHAMILVQLPPDVKIDDVRRVHVTVDGLGDPITESWEF